MAKTGLGTSVWHIFEKKAYENYVSGVVNEYFTNGMIEHCNVIMPQNKEPHFSNIQNLKMMARLMQLESNGQWT